MTTVGPGRDERTMNYIVFTPNEKQEMSQRQLIFRCEDAKRCQLPSNIRLLPCTIDTYGRWGKLFEEYIQAFCQRAAGNDTKLYYFLITPERVTLCESR